MTFSKNGFQHNNSYESQHPTLLKQKDCCSSMTVLPFLLFHSNHNVTKQLLWSTDVYKSISFASGDGFC